MSTMKEIYKEDAPYKPYLMTLVMIGLACGLNKGIQDNYLAQIVGMGEFDRGVAEFFRELPGFLMIGILSMLYMFSAERILRIGTIIMFVGLAMLAVVPASTVLVILSILIFSFGEHLQLAMKNTLGIQLARPGKGGESLGRQVSFYDAGTLVGYIVIVILFTFAKDTSTTFRLVFAAAAAIVLAGFFSASKMNDASSTSPDRRRFYFRKKFIKYYILEVTYGARKQVFFTFGPYLLVLHYGASASLMSLLFAISAISGAILSPFVGRLIDKVGYKTVMVSDTLILVVVCFFYGFAEHFFPMNVSFVICCAMYVLDSIISLAAMASNVYAQDLSDSPEECRATITTGMSVNHLITIFVALFGGWVWKATGIETLFTISAVIGLLNSAYAATIKPRSK